MLKNILFYHHSFWVYTWFGVFLFQYLFLVLVPNWKYRRLFPIWNQNQKYE